MVKAMKAVKKCAVLFLIVVSFVVINAIYMTKLFNDIDKSLDSLPQEYYQTKDLSENKHREYKKTLDSIKKKWTSHTKYLDIVLDHDVSGSFSDSFFVLCKHFDAYDYEGFCAQMSQTKEILKRLKQNEGISPGTLF